MLHAVHEMRSQCAELLIPFASNGVADLLQPPKCLYSMSSSSQTLSAALCKQHYALIDNLEACAGLHECLATMHAHGHLKAGEISAGLQQRRRSDLMKWLPANG